jgi:hypothetical protein
VEKLAKEKEDAERTLMFMDPSILDEKARVYWEWASWPERGVLMEVVLVVVAAAVVVG